VTKEPLSSDVTDRTGDATHNPHRLKQSAQAVRDSNHTRRARTGRVGRNIAVQVKTGLVEHEKKRVKSD